MSDPMRSRWAGIGRQWDEQRQAQDQVRQDGRYEVHQVKGRLQVVAPFSPAFRAWANSHGGRWRYRSQVWSFPVYMEDQVWAELKRIYGEGSCGQ